MSNLPALDLANSLVGLIKSGRRIIQKDLQEAAAKAYGTKLAEGQFNRKDMADALELAVNIVIKDDPQLRIEADKSWQSVMQRLDALLVRLPTQRVRSEEQESFQQFSTPPNFSAAAAFAANIKAGDTVLEPSAGTGSLVAAASNEGVKIIANELSERRVALLRRLVGGRGEVHNENAEQIDNILDVKPTVVLMNPPFSQTAGRMGDRKVPMVAAEHIEAALNTLQPGGRLVAIVGRGMTMGAPTYRAWWTKIGKENTVQANIGVDGKVYEKYGTTFGTRLLVIDKTTPDSGHKPVLAEAQTVEDLMRALEPIRDGRPAAEQQHAEPSGAPLAEASESGRAAALPAPVESGSVGTGERGDGGLAGDGTAGAAEPGGQPVRVEAERT
jgi:predicted RNA methylase